MLVTVHMLLPYRSARSTSCYLFGTSFVISYSLKQLFEPLRSDLCKPHVVTLGEGRPSQASLLESCARFTVTGACTGGIKQLDGGSLRRATQFNTV